MSRFKAGHEYPTVTQIIGQLDKGYGLMYWAAKCGSPDKMKAEQQKAKDIGSLAHSWIEAYMKGADVAEPQPKIRMAIKAFKKFLKGNEIKIIEAERELYSEEYKISGQSDLVVLYRGEITLIDFKCSKGIWEEAKIQIMAYKELLKENDVIVDRQIIVRLDKEIGSYETEEVSDEKYWKIFKILRELYKVRTGK